MARSFIIAWFSADERPNNGLLLFATECLGLDGLKWALLGLYGLVWQLYCLLKARQSMPADACACMLCQ